MEFVRTVGIKGELGFIKEDIYVRSA